MLLSYLYHIVRNLSMPLSLNMFARLASPDDGFLVIGGLSLLFISAAGAVSAMPVLLAVNWLLRPTRYVALAVGACVFLAIQDASIFMQRGTLLDDEPEYIFLKLLSPVLVGAIFLLGSAWLVRRNCANPPLNTDAPPGGGAPVS